MGLEEQAWELKWNASLVKVKGYLVQGRQLASEIDAQESLISVNGSVVIVGSHHRGESDVGVKMHLRV